MPVASGETAGILIEARRALQGESWQRLNELARQCREDARRAPSRQSNARPVEATMRQSAEHIDRAPPSTAFSLFEVRRCR